VLVRGVRYKSLVPVRSKRSPSCVRLQPADAFDLIRWLARSQSDPRKAVAELVQNAIDANAREIVVERRRRGRRAALVVRDDGDGPPAGGPGAGIPEPVLVDEPAASWRSRLSSGGWRVNIGHADYRALSGEPRARLRYLVALFAKDVTVVTTHAANEPVLDRMIDVLAHAERNLLRGPR
jgi:hypothetical protein